MNEEASKRIKKLRSERRSRKDGFLEISFDSNGIDDRRQMPNENHPREMDFNTEKKPKLINVNFKRADWLVRLFCLFVNKP